MQEKEALRALGFDDADHHHHLAQSDLRKHYLKAALVSHPDKNPGDAKAAERFAVLQEAYSFLLQRITAEQDAVEEKAKTQDILDVFLRAMRGENVEMELRNCGVHRPPDLFGIDLGVPFDSRRTQEDADAALDTEPVDINDAFAEAFAADGLDEEGNPLGGWARPPNIDLEDL